jgi:hypothetical protein
MEGPKKTEPVFGHTRFDADLESSEIGSPPRLPILVASGLHSVPPDATICTPGVRKCPWFAGAGATHNPKVAGSNPAPATTKSLKSKGPTAVGPFGVSSDYEVFRPFRAEESPTGANRNHALVGISVIAASQPAFPRLHSARSAPETDFSDGGFPGAPWVHQRFGSATQ